ncbi:alpha/beta fold hydrolase [Postechiella marina]|uniref:Alpha/beta fold hydrolase n=1 Tax=Postechiella marina TaxID=943941 RepID=A0ABP8BZ27_9FLAO
MPVIESTYKPSIFFRKSFVSTVYSGMFRKVELQQERERFTLHDGDFLDLDWSFAKAQSNKLIILLHGLEGNGQRPYMTGPAKLFNDNNIDAVCVNFRGCSGEDNLKFRSYHSGATEDLEDVVNYILKTKQYTDIYFHAISLGANVVCKYLGERDNVPSQIKAAVVVSVPCDLNGSCVALHSLKNKLYAMRFLKHLKGKLASKVEKYPNEISLDDFKNIKSLKQFDDVYTSKAHGFKNGVDYYTQSSCRQFLPCIKVPTLMINALNDSFLSASCYPVKEAKANANLYLEMPNYGGHVGFVDKKNVYYNEKRALEFISKIA